MLKLGSDILCWTIPLHSKEQSKQLEGCNGRSQHRRARIRWNTALLIRVEELVDLNLWLRKVMRFRKIWRRIQQSCETADFGEGCSEKQQQNEMHESPLSHVFSGSEFQACEV